MFNESLYDANKRDCSEIIAFSFITLVMHKKRFFHCYCNSSLLETKLAKQKKIYEIK